VTVHKIGPGGPPAGAITEAPPSGKASKASGVKDAAFADKVKDAAAVPGPVGDNLASIVQGVSAKLKAGEIGLDQAYGAILDGLRGDLISRCVPPAQIDAVVEFVKDAIAGDPTIEKLLKGA